MLAPGFEYNKSQSVYVTDFGNVPMSELHAASIESRRRQAVLNAQHEGRVLCAVCSLAAFGLGVGLGVVL